MYKQLAEEIFTCTSGQCLITVHDSRICRSTLLRKEILLLLDFQAIQDMQPIHPGVVHTCKECSRKDFNLIAQERMFIEGCFDQIKKKGFRFLETMLEYHWIR